MLSRIIDCICHPKFIGRYNKDKAGIVFLTVLFFFLLYVAAFGIRTYTTAPFNDTTYSELASAVVQTKEVDIVYQNHQLQGENKVIVGDGFRLFLLPKEAPKEYSQTDINVVLKETEATVYIGSYRLSSLEYENINAYDFSFADICNNQTEDIYQFKKFMYDIFSTATIPLQSLSFAGGILTSIFYYFVIVVCAGFFSKMVNPTIDRGVRYKLCFYDGIIFFVISMFASLFNVGWLSYVAIGMSLVYVTITFKHIIRVVIKKEEL
ncbi:MAG: hypothetical protein K2I77_05715 [Anaeroplasmataceae bacterium]|nr:hypothetical protein [Anaeroplasmataceae bacterium]